MVRHGPKCLEGPLSLSIHPWNNDPKLGDAGTPPQHGVANLSSGEEPIRWELVHRVRRQIEAGTYDTAEKWQAALEALFSVLE
jgi:hypothetical protein